MSNTVIRQTETTTTTVTAQPTEGRIRFDPAYFKTLPGILKVVQIVSGEKSCWTVEAFWSRRWPGSFEQIGNQPGLDRFLAEAS